MQVVQLAVCLRLVHVVFLFLFLFFFFLLFFFCVDHSECKTGTASTINIVIDSTDGERDMGERGMGV